MTQTMDQQATQHDLEINTQITSHGTVVDIIDPGITNPVPAVVWHGFGTHQRWTMRRLGIELAKRGRIVVIPDHGAELLDGGRTAMLDSYHFVTDELDRDHRSELWGWSYGAACAMAFALTEFPHLRRLVALSGRYRRLTPFSRRHVAALANRVTHPVHLIHGLEDELTPAEGSEEMGLLLANTGVPVHSSFPHVDHGGAILARWSEEMQIPLPMEGDLSGHPMLELLDEICD